MCDMAERVVMHMPLSALGSMRPVSAVVLGDYDRALHGSGPLIPYLKKPHPHCCTAAPILLFAALDGLWRLYTIATGSRWGCKANQR